MPPINRSRRNEMAKKEEELKKKLKKLTHLIIPDHGIDANTQKKIKNAMESKRDTEPHLYTEDPSNGNVLTRMCIALRETKLANETNAAVLHQFPNDITARYLRIMILATERKFSEAEREIEILQKVMMEIDSEHPYSVFQLCVHKADIACYVYHIGPVFYVRAIELYEEAIASLAPLSYTSSQISVPNNGDIEKYIALWRFKLILLYNRMLNHGNILTHGKERTDLTPLNVFHRICSLVRNVLNSTFQHSQYLARSYIEIMDAHQKLRGEQTEETADYILKAIGLPQMDNKLCIEKALNLARDDGSVLEKVGRYYRTHAKSIEEFKEAEKVLERCTQLYPSRHVALHQISLTYRSMWIIHNNFDEAKLFCNPARTGKRPKSSWRGRGRGRQRSTAYSDLAEHVRNYDSTPPNWRDKGQNKTYHPKHNRCQTHDDDKYQDHPCATEDPGYDSLTFNVNTPETTQARVSRSQSEHSDVESITSRASEISLSPTVTPTQTFVPKYPSGDGKKPKQYRKPDYFDTLRTSNPMRHAPTRENEYLTKAIEALEKANEAVSGSASRYHIDLARLYISNNQFQLAEECFVKAETYFYEAGKTSVDSSTYNEKAYLYEQWAMLNDRSGLSGDDLDDVKQMYRLAVTNSVGAKEKSRIAFYRLKDIINSQLIDSPEDIAIKTEQALLQKLVENFGHAHGKIREVLEQDPKNVEMLWNLVDVQYKTGKYLDAFGNLHTALVLLTPAEIKAYCDASDEPNVIDPISVTLKAVESIGSRRNIKCIEMVRELFRELTKSDEKKEADVLPFMGDSSHDMVRPLLEVLEDETKLNLMHEWNNPGKFLGVRSHEVYEHTLPKARCVLILADTIVCGDSSNEWYTVNDLVGEDSIRPILVHNEPLSADWERLPRIKHCPRLPMGSLVVDNCETSKNIFLENFLRAVFQNIHTENSEEDDD